jgi:hypothetical protein
MYMFLLYLGIRHSMALYGHDRVRSTHQTMRRRAYACPPNCADGGPGEGDIYPLWLVNHQLPEVYFRYFQSFTSMMLGALAMLPAFM